MQNERESKRKERRGLTNDKKDTKPAIVQVKQQQRQQINGDKFINTLHTLSHTQTDNT